MSNINSNQTNKTTPSPINMQPGGSGPGGQGPGGRFLRPVEKPKDIKNTLTNLLHFFKGQVKQIFLLFCLVLFSSIAALLTPYFSGKAIDALNEMSKISVLQNIILMLVLIYIADAISKFLQNWVMSSVSQKMVKRIRTTLFDKMQKLPVSFFDRHPHGELMSRLSNDTDNIAGILGLFITQMMSIVIILVGSFCMMLYLSPIMTFFSLISIPLVFLLTKTISNNTKKLFREQQLLLGRLNAHVEETITGIHVVKAYSHEKYAVGELKEINDRLCIVSTKAQVWSGYIMPIMNVINNLSFAIIAGAGGILAVNNLISIGTIAIFINYSRQFGRPLNELASLYNSFQSALASAERVFEMLNSDEEIDDIKDAVALRDIKGDIHFDHVDFGYNPNKLILKDVSFSIKPGMTVALVGPTGAGKTTIINLITRFYDVSSGQILIDGNDIKNYTRDSLRQAFGMVLQDTYLFTGTIRENICYGRPNANYEEMVAAAYASGADTFIERLPLGYETILTESGQNISEGQRQLLAIARTILCNPGILILDEATSSVDTRTELKIQEAFIKLMKNKTSFIIAHRLSTIIGADIIMLIQNGELAEIGNHESLMKQKGAYSKLFGMQIHGIDIGRD